MIYINDITQWTKEYNGDLFDAVLCDPPYELGFMGKKWDSSGVAFKPETWQGIYNHMKPGALLLAFGGTRTFHRLMVAIEDAGFEMRDVIMYVYGSGFPKSLDISKQLDKQENDKWIKISKAVDNADVSSIIKEWIKYLNNAKSAEPQSQKIVTAIGMNTLKNNSAPGVVAQSVSQRKSLFNALIAELRLKEAQATSGVKFTVPENAVVNTTHFLANVTFAASKSLNQKAKQLTEEPERNTPVFTVLCDVKELPSAKTTETTRAEEALMIWLGSKKSSKMAATSALCVALTDDLKHIILSQSKTFLSLDTTQQMECASAITVTITKSTAAHLITFTANTLKNKAIDKVAGAEREVVGLKPGHRPNRVGHRGQSMAATYTDATESHPATDEAKQWDGYGTALKPAYEPVVIAMKPTDGTYANNAIEYGVAGLNIDGCRIEAGRDYQEAGWGERYGSSSMPNMGSHQTRPWVNSAIVNGQPVKNSTPSQNGRWPANLIHDGSDEVMELFPQSDTTRVEKPSDCDVSGSTSFDSMRGNRPARGYNENGSAARFFYTAKASKKERNAGLPIGMTNNHPTVKPLSVTEYLARLILPPKRDTPRRILIPFSGSGSERMGALLAGWDEIVGVEMSPEYAKIDETRFDWWERQIEIHGADIDKILKQKTTTPSAVNNAEYEIKSLFD